MDSLGEEDHELMREKEESPKRRFSPLSSSVDDLSKLPQPRSPPRTNFDLDLSASVDDLAQFHPDSDMLRYRKDDPRSSRYHSNPDDFKEIPVDLSGSAAKLEMGSVEEFRSLREFDTSERQIDIYDSELYDDYRFALTAPIETKIEDYGDPLYQMNVLEEEDGKVIQDLETHKCTKTYIY